MVTNVVHNYQLLQAIYRQGTFYIATSCEQYIICELHTDTMAVKSIGVEMDVPSPVFTLTLRHSKFWFVVLSHLSHINSIMFTMLNSYDVTNPGKNVSVLRNTAVKYGWLSVLCVYKSNEMCGPNDFKRRKLHMQSILLPLKALWLDFLCVNCYNIVIDLLCM